MTSHISCSCRKVFVLVQESIAMLGKCSPETGVKLYLDASLTADTYATLLEKETDGTEYGPIAYEFLSQAFALYEERIVDSKVQYRCIESIVGTLLASKALSKEDYESLVTKTAQFSARILKKPDQCQLVTLCAHLFYPIGAVSCTDDMKYSNPQRALECLQRSLKLADACTTASPSNVGLFVDLLDHYVFFFEKKNPLITHAYVSGLVALIKEHISNVDSFGGDASIVEARNHFQAVVRYIRQKKSEGATAELFAPVQLGE
jgi:vacuolar protein sorting-associated protein 35